MWFQHYNEEMDGKDRTLRSVARVEKPIVGEFPSRTSLTSTKNLSFLHVQGGLTRAIVLYC